MCLLNLNTCSCCIHLSSNQCAASSAEAFAPPRLAEVCKFFRRPCKSGFPARGCLAPGRERR